MYVAYFPCTGSVQLLTNILWHCDSTVTETMYLILIKKHHFANYNSTSGDYPTVICPSCKRCLRDRDKFGHDAKGKLLPLRYHKMRGTSRNFDECQCSLCPGVRSRDWREAPTWSTVIRSGRAPADRWSTSLPRLQRSRRSVKAV